MKTAPLTLIQGILVGHSLFTHPFACGLSTCHGASFLAFLKWRGVPGH